MSSVKILSMRMNKYNRLMIQLPEGKFSAVVMLR